MQKNGWSPRLLRLIDRLFSLARHSLEREKGVAEEEGSVAAVFVVVSWVLQSSWLDAPTLTPPDRPPVRQSVRPTNQKPDVDRQLPRERASDAKDFSRSRERSRTLARPKNVLMSHKERVFHRQNDDRKWCSLRK